MNKIKNIVTLFTIACATLFLTQCKKEIVENPVVTPSAETIEVSLNVNNVNSKTDIDGYTIKWEMNDSLCVVGAQDGMLGYISAQNEGTSAYFTGTINKITTDNQTIHFYYVGKKANKKFPMGTTEYTLDISKQTGSLDDIEDNLHLMHGAISSVEAGATNLGTVTMTSMMSIAKLQFGKTGNLASTIACYGAFTLAKLNVKTSEFTPGMLDEELINSVVSYVFTSGVVDVVALNGVTTSSAGKDGELSVSNEYYMVLLPGNQTFTFANEVLDDVWRSAANTVNVEANKIYTYNGQADVAVTVELDKELAGALPGRFSVGKTNGAKIYTYFSKGNVQYQASSATWQFAPNQYEALQTANNSISAIYSGWIDLFGWGTTGNQDERLYTYQDNYMPYSSSNSKSSETQAIKHNLYGYGPDYYSATHYDLTVDNKSDWAIHFNTSNTGWRTPSMGEWNYMMITRSDNYRFAKVSLVVNVDKNVEGILVFPDGFEWTSEMGSIPEQTLNKTTNVSFSIYTYNLTQFGNMQAAGVVFLPKTGKRSGKTTWNPEKFGYYWSSTSIDQQYAYNFRFGNDNPSFDPQMPIDRYSGCCVRLIRNVE